MTYLSGPSALSLNQPEIIHNTTVIFFRGGCCLLPQCFGLLHYVTVSCVMCSGAAKLDTSVNAFAPSGLWRRSPQRPSVRKYALHPDGRARLALQMFGLCFVCFFWVFSLKLIIGNWGIRHPGTNGLL